MNLVALIADLQSNLVIWVPIAVSVISSVITGATKYPQATGFVAFLQKVLGALSAVEHVDAPANTLAIKIPFVTRTKAPAKV